MHVFNFKLNYKIHAAPDFPCVTFLRLGTRLTHVRNSRVMCADDTRGFLCAVCVLFEVPRFRYFSAKHEITTRQLFKVCVCVCVENIIID